MTLAKVGLTASEVLRGDIAKLQAGPAWGWRQDNDPRNPVWFQAVPTRSEYRIFICKNERLLPRWA